MRNAEFRSYGNRGFKWQRELFTNINYFCRPF